MCRRQVHLSQIHSVATAQVDTSKDGQCGVLDAAPQWMDCGIPCPVGPEARMNAEEKSGFGWTVVAFMSQGAALGEKFFKLLYALSSVQ